LESAFRKNFIHEGQQKTDKLPSNHNHDEYSISQRVFERFESTCVFRPSDDSDRKELIDLKESSRPKHATRPTSS